MNIGIVHSHYYLIQFVEFLKAVIIIPTLDLFVTRDSRLHPVSLLELWNSRMQFIYFINCCYVRLVQVKAIVRVLLFVLRDHYRNLHRLNKKTEYKMLLNIKQTNRVQIPKILLLHTNLNFDDKFQMKSLGTKQ